MVGSPTQEVEIFDEEDEEEETRTLEAPDEEDEEAALEELIEAMAQPEEAAIEADEASPREIAPRGREMDEFTCSSCHLIMARSCLADEERVLCRDCLRQATPERRPLERSHLERP